MEWSVVDLASITATLIDMLQTAVTNSPLWTLQVHGQPIQKFNIDVSGAMPAVVRDQTDCMLSLYLLHVSRDPFWRNTPPDGIAGRTNATQPLSLNLSYLLTAYDNKNFWHEQQAMSIALSCFHQNPIYRSATEEFTITVEADTIEEMSRLWQAITVPIRLSAMFRVAVVFLRPSLPPPTASPPPNKLLSLSVGADLTSVTPQLYQVATRVTWLIPSGATQPEQVGDTLGQPVTVGGDTVRIGGLGLDGPTAAAVYISIPNTGPEWPITAWRGAPPLSPNEMTLAFPQAYAALPAAGTQLTGTPPPGRYVVTVGPAAPGQRSAPVPLAVAPRVDGVANPPQLKPNASNVYTVSGMGFTPGQVAVTLNGYALSAAAAAAPGAFAVTADGTTITFMVPTAPALPHGRYFLHIQVNSVQAPPNWWIDLP
jgi:hypothetical protein